ncbi:MAG: hypothetical protein IJU84_09345 [Clostridia bacterium]|nr:hypothetical protein [Clostridia bacterium]
MFFVSEGIDYEFEIRIDGNTVFYQEGMFRKVDLEIPENADGKILEVIVYPAPSRAGATKGAQEADLSFKPAVCYGWDFHPRLVTQGIWGYTYFEERERSFVKNVYVTYELSEDRKKADVTVETETDGNGVLFLTVKDPFGKIAYRSEINGSKHVFTLENPYLWWCHNYGEQNLYSFEFSYTAEGTVRTITKNIGFRRIKLVAQECNWWIDRFPFTQGYPPITVELNGVQIFAKGSNWVPPEVFFGEITDERYEQLLSAFKEMHGNFLRVWGGGIVNRESFFEICDREGILIWQEFPLSCNHYIDDEHYLKVAEAESVEIIKRVREHACLAVWCGGNELYVGGTRNTPQSHIIRLLNHLCFTLDKNTPYLDTSPMFGMRHGHYTFSNHEWEECFQSFNIVKATAYTEFGCPSLADYDYLKQVIPEEDLNLEAILECKPSWVAHHAVKAWTEDSWLQIKNIEHYFGKTKDLKDAAAKSQLMQTTGYKLMFEEARKQRPNCGFALNWCFDEPYPNAAGNALISYPVVKKPAYFGVENSLRDVVLSARVKKFSWVEGETFTAEIWMLNDGIKEVKEGTAEVLLKFGNEEIPVMKWNYGKLEANTNKQGHSATIVLPKRRSCVFELILRCEHHEYDNRYKLLYYSKETAAFAESLREKPMDFDGIVEETIGLEDVETEIIRIKL